jgi:hypothetical protein
MSNNILVTIGVGLITGLIGLIIGHRLAIGRDKRIEFNAIAEPIRIQLLHEKESLKPTSGGPHSVDLMRLRERLPFWKRGRFDRALQNYQQGKKEQNWERDQYGHISYRDRTLIIHSIDALLRIVKIQ